MTLLNHSSLHQDQHHYHCNLCSYYCSQLSSESYGLLLLLISAILFSGMSCFLKLASNSGIPSTELVFFRATFQGILVVIGLCTNREAEVQAVHVNLSIHVHQQSRRRLLIWIPFGSNRREMKIVIMRGIFGACGFIMYFYSISALPIGDAITLFSLYPIHTLFLAYFFLGEQIRLPHIFATVACVTGATLIAGPSFLLSSSSSSSSESNTDMDSNYNPIGYITAFLGSFFGATVITLIRKAGTLGVNALQLLFSWAIFGIFFSLFFRYLNLLIFTSSSSSSPSLEKSWILPPSQQSWLYILGMCSIGSIAHFLLNYAGRMSPAGLSSIVRSSDIVFAYIGEVVVFGVIPTWTTILGVVFVLLSLVIVAVQKYKEDDTCHDCRNDNHANVTGINTGMVDDDNCSEMVDLSNNNGNQGNVIDEVDDEGHESSLLHTEKEIV